jgi:hypothetical protein
MWDRVDRSLYNGSSLHRLGMGPRQGTRVVAIPARQASAALGNSGARATGRDPTIFAPL